ncbi:unnamed protein product [Sphagnum jensenii]|uniref:Uncharacterized protein n=1 Tax=Sphagnum jensenii TaxID=128206 RepID=A0ABP0WFG5_9BRYO
MEDCRNWNEKEYRASIVAERDVHSRTIFAAAFVPATASAVREHVATACSNEAWLCTLPGIAKPSMTVWKHDGPAYGLLSYGEDHNALLLRGPFSALCPIPETNALAANSRTGCLFAAAGDGCAYVWDMNTMVCQGHSDYLHCIASQPSHNQIITGSEDGTARIWGKFYCQSGECVAALDPWNAVWVLVCGNGGHCVTLWRLPGLDCVTHICMCAAPQAVTIANDQILTMGTQPILSRWSFGCTLLSQAMCAPLSAFSVSVHPSRLTAVAGYGGLVDIISEFGSHLCTFCCG